MEKSSGCSLRRAAVFAVATLVVVVAAACGSSKSSTTATTAGASATSGGGGSKAYAGKTLKLGAVFSLTGGGGVYGPQQKNAVELAQDVINAAGGVNGANLSITVVDDAS